LNREEEKTDLGKKKRWSASLRLRRSFYVYCFMQDSFLLFLDRVYSSHHENVWDERRIQTAESNENTVPRFLEKKWHCEPAFWPGLPDGVFSNKKSKFGYILESLEMENVGIFLVHLEYLTAIWYDLWPFVTFYSFPRFGMFYQ
jgi:hypothetical protein